MKGSVSNFIFHSFSNFKGTLVLLLSSIEIPVIGKFASELPSGLLTDHPGQSKHLKFLYIRRLLQNSRDVAIARVQEWIDITSVNW